MVTVKEYLLPLANFANALGKVVVVLGLFAFVMYKRMPTRADADLGNQCTHHAVTGLVRWYGNSGLAHSGSLGCDVKKMDTAVRFELTCDCSNGFAVRCLRPLGYTVEKINTGAASWN
jgi:hypothetical protein